MPLILMKKYIGILRIMYSIQPKDRLKWGYGRLPEHENLYGTVKQLLQKEKQLEMLTGSGMKEMDYREEITSLEHACSKLVDQPDEYRATNGEICDRDIRIEYDGESRARNDPRQQSWGLTSS